MIKMGIGGGRTRAKMTAKMIAAMRNAVAIDRRWIVESGDWTELRARGSFVEVEVRGSWRPNLCGGLSPAPHMLNDRPAPSPN